MIKNLKHKSELVLAIIALILIIIVILRPPTDSDGGPMLAYNFLFFLPMFFIAGILALIAIIIAIRKLILKRGNKKPLTIITFALSIPVLLASLSVFSYFFIPRDYDYPDVVLTPDPTYNCSDSIKLKTGKTLHFVGYNWGKELENRRVYISLTPHACDTFSMVETYCYQGSAKMDVYYQLQKDSIYVYIPDQFGFHTHVREKYLNRIPVKNIKLPSSEIDSMLTVDKKKLIKKFNWGNN
jgi:amino acid transporter